MKKQVVIFYAVVDDKKKFSVETQQRVLDNLDVEKYDIKSIEITTNDLWMQNGATISKEQALLWVDYAFISGYGKYMQDGQLQKILDYYRIPYNGSKSLISKLCFSKSACKDLLKIKGIKTPSWQTHNLNSETDILELADRIFQTSPQPCLIKPDRSANSVSASLVDNKNDLVKILEKIQKIGNKVIIEEYIAGSKASVGLVENLREKDLFVLPPVEIKLHIESEIETSISNNSIDLICPASFDDKSKEKLQEIAIKVHRELELKDYSQINFIIHPKRGIYVIKVNTLPNLAKDSVMEYGLKAVGVDWGEFFDSCLKIIFHK